MPTSTQSIREIVATQPSAAKVFQRFDIDFCSQAENRSMVPAPSCNSRSIKSSKSSPMRRPGARRFRLSILHAYPSSRLIQYIVRVHHQYVRQELPRLAEMAQKLAAKRSVALPN